MIKRLQRTSEKLTMATDRLAEADEVVTKVVAQLKGLDGKDIDSLRKRSQAIQSDIKTLKEAVTGKTIEKQGLSRNLFDTTTNAQLQLATQNIINKMQVPGKQEESLVINAEKAMDRVIQRINTFFDDKWKAYRQQVEATKVNLFKDYKAIE
jgi:hypothetical protein